jgi:hypothetical protein
MFTHIGRGSAGFDSLVWKYSTYHILFVFFLFSFCMFFGLLASFCARVKRGMFWARKLERAA